jgi:signal peptidase I
VSDLPDPSPFVEKSGKPRLVSVVGRILGFATTEVLETILPAFVIALLINLFLAQGTYVHGHSMEPNLHPDQRLIIEKVSYWRGPLAARHGPRRGDIVVIRLEEYEIPLIKRVVGLPGETVEIRDNRLYIDGEMLAEGYLPGVEQRNYGPVQVPPLHVFVMGDNRNASNDSRVFGAVRIDQIVGRAWLTYWPMKEIGFFE